ncbi:hypothetical protein [Brasilonema sp. UFV-L1]
MPCFGYSNNKTDKSDTPLEPPQESDGFCPKGGDAAKQLLRERLCALRSKKAPPDGANLRFGERVF